MGFSKERRSGIIFVMVLKPDPTDQFESYLSTLVLYFAWTDRSFQYSNPWLVKLS